MASTLNSLSVVALAVATAAAAAAAASVAASSFPAVVARAFLFADSAVEEEDEVYDEV
jgi:hypothetical protein